MLSEEAKGAARRAVEEAGVCPYCALLALGQRTIALYQNSPASLLSLISSSSSVDHSRFCPVCGGLFALCHSESAQKMLFEGVAGCGYLFATYRLTIHLPAAFLVRQHALTLFLSSGTAEAAAEAVDPKQAMKWILGPLLDRTLGTRFDRRSPFLVDLHVAHPQLEAHGDAFLGKFTMTTTVKDPATGRTRSATGPPNSQTAPKFLGSVPAALFLKHCPWPLPAVDAGPTFDLRFSHESIFVAGRYCKYAPKLFQTPFSDRETSVQELIVLPLLADFGAKEYRFSASGREDADVRMLGDGRPFAIELIDPHRAIHDPEDFAAMQQRINDATKLIQVSDLQAASPTEALHVKENETHKMKHYRALVWSSRELSSEDLSKLEVVHDLKIAQKTPLRVLHRRSLMVREKMIYGLKVEQLSPHFFVLYLHTSAGTYIKEFVHGDLGRTTPSVGTILGCTADILQLDVMQVDAKFPPQIRPAPKLDVSFSLPESFIMVDREAAAATAPQPVETTPARDEEEEPLQKKPKTN